MKNTGDKKDKLDEIIRLGTSFDEIVTKRCEQEALEQMEEAKKQKQETLITKFEDLPSDMTFSKKAFYKVFNRKNKTESFINGIQFEGFLGSNKNLRQNILERKLDCFANDEFYIKFDNAKI